MLQKKKEQLAWFTALMVCVVFGFILGSTLHLIGKESSITITNWPKYRDSRQQLEFQYPLGWSVDEEKGNIVRISPPEANSILSDLDNNLSVKYGIRVMPLNAPYPSFPVKILRSDIENNFARINSFSYQTTTVNLTNNTSIKLLYNVEHNNLSLLAFKVLDGEVIQIELGQGFPGTTRSISELVAFFGIVTSLK